MSQENVEVVRVAHEALVGEGLERFMEHLTEDIEYRSIEGAPDDHGPMHGQHAVQAWLQDWIDTFDGFRVEQVELIDAGGDMVVEAERYSGRGKLSGVETESAVWNVFTIRDGKIAQAREYSTREEALEAAGLSV